MKHFLYTSLLMAVCLTSNIQTICAQSNDKFCGTWYSAAFQEGGKSVRHVLNICKQNETFAIQFAIEDTAGKTLCRYAPCKDIKQNGNIISGHYQMAPCYIGGPGGRPEYFGPSIEYVTAELVNDKIVCKRYYIETGYRLNSDNRMYYAGEKYVNRSDIIFYRTK